MKSIIRLIVPIVIVLTNTGCTPQVHHHFGYEVNAYRKIIGIQENRLQKCLAS